VEEEAYFGRIPRMEWRVHTANPVGGARIIMAMRAAEGFWGKVGNVNYD